MASEHIGIAYGDRHCPQCGDRIYDITLGSLKPLPQDFPEDTKHENGSYCCRCSQCGHHFVGLKRRIACKLCETVWALTDERDALLADKARLDWLERQWREGVIAEICGTCDDVDRGLGRNWNLILDAITTQADTIRAAIDAATRTSEAPTYG